MESSSSAPTTNLNYKLCNIVYSAKLSGKIDIHLLETMLADTKISGRNSSIHIRRDYGSFLLQKSGRVLIFKCFSQEKVNSALGKLLVELYDLMTDVNIASEPVVCNMVGNFNLGYRMNLGKLSLMIKCEYEPDLHVSLFTVVRKTKVTITHTGKCIIFGAKTVSDFEDSVRRLIDIGQYYQEHHEDVVLH